MKQIRMITVLLFALLILVPLCLFNFEEGAVSEIDNRVLEGNPFVSDGRDLTSKIERYVSDRIGLRDKMILSYTVLNDRLFGEMVHPSYSYGKDGYVFGAGVWSDSYNPDYHGAFADMVKQIQDYCEARDVPFVFVFEPAKPAVLQEYIADGINYNRDWVDRFLEDLDERGIRYVDNTVTLRQKFDEGVMVFNQKYDANHWNEWGAYYGTSAMLEALQEDFPNLLICDERNMVVEEHLQTSLPVSQFPIHEYTPSIWPTMETSGRYGMYFSELELHPSHQKFGYYVNAQRQQEGAPKALVFQGSYMNTGYKFLEYSFGEYIYVHDYQNVINFDYYYNIFQPECVIFEVAEYTLSDYYFNYDAMCAMDLNPTLDSVLAQGLPVRTTALNQDEITVEQGKTLTKIRWSTDAVYDHLWLELDETYDMRACEGGYEVTIHTTTYNSCWQDAVVTGLADQQLTVYQ